MFIWEWLRVRIFKLLYTASPSLFPVQKAATSDQYGVSLLLCHRDMTLVLYSLSSLFYQIGQTLPIYILNDGSLTAEDKKTLHRLFTVQIENKERALEQVKKSFKKSRYLIKYLNDPIAHIKRLKLAMFFL